MKKTAIIVIIGLMLAACSGGARVHGDGRGVRGAIGGELFKF